MATLYLSDAIIEGTLKSTGLKTDQFIFVSSKSDLPAAVSGVITLEAAKTYFITGTIDLLGDRLVAGNNTTIIGGSSENCILKSTGLAAGTALLSSVYSLPIRNIAFQHSGKVLDLDGTGNSTAALDWFGVNFVDCPDIGTVKSYTNFIMSDCALLNSAGMVFDGTIGTVGFAQCLFSGRAGQTTMNFPSTLIITRRIRATYSSWVAFGGATAINVDPAAVIPVESYILDTCNFSGGATYTGGVTYTSNTAFFSNCKGITNSSEIGQMFAFDQTTATTISVADTYVKANVTTTASSINQKFSHTANRLTYTGGLNRSFKVSAIISATGTLNNIIHARIAKNGVTIADSEAQATISGNGRSENMKSQTLIEMTENDYVEVWLKNSASANITVSELNVIVEALN